MFKEFEEFKLAEAKINARIEELSLEVEQKKNEHAKAAATYKKMMVDDSAGVKTYSVSELNKAKMLADELASEIQVAEERLRMVQDGKSEKLEGMLDKVKKGWERETEKLENEIQVIFSAAREHRAKLTLEIQKANKQYRKATELRQALNEAERISGLSYSSCTDRLGISESPPIKGYYPSSGVSFISDDGVIPSEEEINKVYRQGEVSAWISHYANTGKLVINDELKLKQDKLAESKEQSGGGLLGKLFSRVDRNKIRTMKIQAPNPKKAAEQWIKDHPTATIISNEQRSNSMYEIQYTLPEEDGNVKN